MAHTALQESVPKDWQSYVILLARHDNAHLGFAVLDQLAADVHCRAVDRAGELERRAYSGVTGEPLGSVRLRPGWLGLIVRAADDAGECGSGFVLFECHSILLF
jgi:hypothetical protein